MINSVDAIRITTEVTNNQQPKKQDTVEQALFRSKVAKQIEAMKANGITIEIPFEMP